MKRINCAVFFVVLVNIVYAANAETILAAKPVETTSDILSVEVSPVNPSQTSGRVVKYVRNITRPNGFGESKIINDAVFYSKNGDVKAETGDKLEYAIVISASNEDVEGVSVRDFIPAYTEYVPDSTIINTDRIADVEGKSPIVDTVMVNDPGAVLHSGIIKAGSSAVVKFRVRVNLMLDLPEIQ